jgi:hypothetical protein
MLKILWNYMQAKGKRRICEYIKLYFAESSTREILQIGFQNPQLFIRAFHQTKCLIGILF